MATGNNNENNDLNDAVEQVVTEDSRSSSEALTGNQHNQQSTTANTVATGADSIAPIASEDNSSGQNEDKQTTTEEAEENNEINSERISENRNEGEETDASSNVVSSEIADKDNGGDSNVSVPNSTEHQDVGGHNSDSVTAEGGNNIQHEENESLPTSSILEGAVGGAVSDEVIDTQAFEVSVEPERSIFSDELEHSDTTVDTLTFAVNVSPVNDAPTAVDKLFTMLEDGVITFTAEELLVGAKDIDSETLHIDTVTYTGTDGVLSENPDGSFSFAPNENFNGHVDLGFTVSDSELTVDANIELLIEGVNDIPVAGATSYQVDEDHVLTFTKEQLLANSSDVEGEVYVQSVSYPGFEGELVENSNGTYSFTPNPNYYGELAFDVVIVDEEGASASTTANIQIISINDPVIATDDFELAGAEPLIRLDSAPEHGTLEYLNEEYEWVEMVVGQEYSADTEIQFVPNATDVQSATCDIQVGSFDSDPNTLIFDGVAKASDWGIVDGNTATFIKDDVTITTEVTNGELFAWNGAGSSVGAGIGDQDRHGLSDDDQLIVTIEGEEVNQITFQLDGLGGWFDESHPRATEVIITAYDAEGNQIDSQGGYRESGEYQDLYSFTTDQPVHHFELGTTGGGGTYVVQNMTVSRTLSEHLQLVTIQPDGSETNSELTLDLNFNTAHLPMDVTEELINIDEGIVSTPIEVLEDGQLVLNASDLLVNDTDADGDTLTIVEVHTTDNSHGEVSLNENGQVIYTPDPNYSGEAEFHYIVTDGNGSFDSATVSLNVIPQQDAPIITSNLELTIDEDGAITLTQEQLLKHAIDVDGDQLTASNLIVDGHAVIEANEDGSFTITPDENFNGQLAIQFDVSDGIDVVAAGIDLTVNAVNDVAVLESKVFSLNEDGVLVITDEQLLSGSFDADGDELEVESVVYDGNHGQLESNGDGTHTFTPNENFNGSLDFTYTVTDGSESVTSDINVIVEAVNDAPIFTESHFIINEDNSILITKAQLLENASDVDGDQLSIVGITVEPDKGSIVQDENGDWLYTPVLNESGYVDLTVSITDGTVVVDFASIISITPNADAPSLTLSLGEASITDFPAEDDNSIADILAQWSTDNVGGVIETHQESVYTGVDDGRGRVIELEANRGDESNLYQDLDIQVGDKISLSFDYSARAGYVGEGSQIDVYFEGELIESITQPTVGWHTYNYELTATTDNPRLEFDAPGSDSLGGILDKIKIIEVPTEDQSISINIKALLTDIDGSESLQSLIIDDVPEGATLSDGTNTFIATADENSIDVNQWSLDTLEFLPAEHFDGEVNLNVSATSVEEENGDTETITLPLVFTVEAVADAPSLSVTNSEGVLIDDGAEIRDDANIIELNLQAELVDQDLSETMVVTMGGAPEGSVIHYDGDAVINDQSNGLISYADTNVTVTFEGEGAGFQNSAGYYIVESDGTISGAKLMFENASQQGSGGNLIPGQSSFSFDIEAGQSFNLFVVPNGYNYNDFGAMTDGEFVFRDTNGEPATMNSVDPQLIFVHADGTETLVRSQNGDTIYHGGNSVNLNQDGVEHTRTTMNEEGELVYGIEDLYGGGDRDYDDFTFTIDLGEVNQSIYSGEIEINNDEPVIIPTVILDQTLALELPDGFSDEFDLIIEATTTEESNQDSVTTTHTVHIDAIEYAPEVSPIEIVIAEDGSITLSQEELLATASDLNGDELIANNLIVNNGDATIELNENGSYTITPSENFNGDVQIGFDVSDGLHTVANNLQLTVTPVNDAPHAPSIVLSANEDAVITIDPEFLLNQATDVDGDSLTLDSLVVRSPSHAVLTQNQDGLYQVVVPENFNGQVELAYAVSDGHVSTEGSVNLNIIPVDDAPFQNGNAHLATNEDGAVTFNNADLLNLFGDVDSALTISRVVTAEGEEAEGTVIDNGDGTWTFTPTDDFAGTTGLQVVVTDGTTDVSMDMNVYVRPIADGVVITTSFDGPLVFPEDTTGHFGLNIEQLDTSEIMTSVVMTGYPIGFVVGDGEHTVFITEEQQDIDISSWNIDNMTMTPPADFNGNFFVTVSVVSLDEVEDPADNPVTQELGTHEVSGSPFVLDDNGYALLSSDDLLGTLDEGNHDKESDNAVTSVVYTGDNGTLIDNQNGTWSFWANPDFEGDIVIDFTTENGEQHQVEITSEVERIEAFARIETNPVMVQEESSESSNYDYTSIPGGIVNIDIPDAISQHSEVNHIQINGLPSGVEPVQGLSDDNGSYAVSDISQPVALAIDDDFSGEVRVEMVGMTAMDDPIDGLVGISIIDVDSSYEMQTTSADNSFSIVGHEDSDGGQDWTEEDNTSVGVDVLDDSSSFESNQSSSNVDDDLSNLVDH
ncbi:tandem-95 repeat protein [Aliivibrio fischeri]|uniref:tandem-95 repeat protein n=1 Tax=Aliivibrio fischeri TaxID=668 RepID=UPI0012D8D23D|nr:tandem-95 repeat protein [Aliivibrio fischeri]MUK92721.1 tandem-95 repeat protein [Aliivibrio fischeri]